jgi:hypothetical protein
MWDLRREGLTSSVKRANAPPNMFRRKLIAAMADEAYDP